MMIKVNSEYLDFNDVIEVEEQARLFQDVSGVYGDFSYSFSIPITDRNLALLDLKSINSRLSYTQKKDCKLYSDAGEELFAGFLRIESVGESIEASFFSGNNSWFEATKKRLREYNFKRLQKDFNVDNVVASWSVTGGEIVWPLVDKGTLYQRNTATLYDNDFQPFIYVKDVISLILAQSGGIKIAGDILKEPIYNTMITTNGGLSAIDDIIEAQTVYVGKTGTQVVISATITAITFTDTSAPFESSQYWDTSTSTYTVPSDWITGSVEFNLKTSSASSNYLVSVAITINGSLAYTTAFPGSSGTFADTVTLNNISAGDQVVVKTGTALSTNFNILEGSYLKIKPIKLRRVYPQQLLPDIDANEFISNVFTQMNIFSVYDQKTKTINTKLLENIKKETAIDISEYVSKITNNDMTEIVSDYAKASRFLYGEAGDDFTEQYNAANPDLFYGGGYIVIDNDFLEDSSDFVDLDFFAPFQVQIPWLGFRLPLLEMNEFTLERSTDYTRVTISTNNIARFQWRRDPSNFIVSGDLVKIIDKGGADSYSGIYKVSAAGEVGQFAYIETEVIYDIDSSGTIELLNINETLNEDQITICNVPASPLTDFTNLDAISYSDTDYTTIALGYFWLPQVKLPINRIKQSLTFGPINDPDFYQRTLLETYYSTTNQILNDPITLTVEAYLPETVFRSLNFLTPVRLKMKEFNGLFLLNKRSGYNGSHMACELELIKVSNSELTSATTGVIPEAAPPDPDPTPDPIYGYRATIYECGTCIEVDTLAVVSSTVTLTKDKFYEVQPVGGGTSYVAEIVSGSSTSTIDYEIVNTTPQDTCAAVSC